MSYYYGKIPEYFEIGETYLKLKFDFNEKNQLLIKDTYEKYLKKYSKEILKENRSIKISIEFEEGSLKTKIKIWGLVGTIYFGIGQYGSFRQGVREIFQDVKSLSESIFDITENQQNIGNERIIRFEKRTGITGRIQDIYRRIDSLERNLNTLSQQEITSNLNSIKQEIANILVLLPDDVNQQFISELPNNYRNHLPEPDDRKVNYFINRYGLKPDEEDEFIE